MHKILISPATTLTLATLFDCLFPRNTKQRGKMESYEEPWYKLPAEVSDIILAQASRGSELVSGVIPCLPPLESQETFPFLTGINDYSHALCTWDECSSGLQLFVCETSTGLSNVEILVRFPSSQTQINTLSRFYFFLFSSTTCFLR